MGANIRAAARCISTKLKINGSVRIFSTILVLYSLLLTACGSAGSALPTVPPPAALAPTTAPIVVKHTAQPTPTRATTETETPSPTITLTPSETETETPTSSPTVTFTPFLSATPLPPPTVTPTLTPTSSVISIAFSPFTPPELRAGFDQLMQVQPGRYRATLDFGTASVTFLPASAGAFQWVYVPAVAFPTLADAIQWKDIQSYWNGDPNVLAPLSDNLSGKLKTPTLIVSQDVLDWLKVRLGPPAESVPIQVVAPEAVAPTVWKNRPAAWTIQPFQRLDPSLKALLLDDANILSPSFNANNYPLAQTFALSGGTSDSLLNDLLKLPGFSLTNRSPERLTVLVMTGVTALTRATAYAMEASGIETPATEILPFLSDSHIVHTSNEVSFAKDCPAPNPSGEVMTFCSREKYFALLEKINLKIVELTGNHVNDWGRAALSNSLDMYDKAGMLTFGGGRNLADAQDALTVTHHGNSFAFIGCNPVGPAYAWAKEDQPGSAPCDLKFLESEIKRLKAAGYIVIMDIQYTEYYTYAPPDDQVAYFDQFAKWGADLVMGTQAHVPQGFGFTGKTFIHYGIGNLFFDQMDVLITRQMFADKLAFYNGHLIGGQFFTGLIENYSHPRPMTPKERNQFLWSIFRASGWMGN